MTAFTSRQELRCNARGVALKLHGFLADDLLALSHLRGQGIQELNGFVASLKAKKLAAMYMYSVLNKLYT